MSGRAVIDADLPSGMHARIFVTEHVIGFRVNGRTTIAHQRGMDDDALAELARCCAELAGATA